MRKPSMQSKEAVRLLDIPVFLGGRIKRLEDVKKYLYAGAEAVFLDGGNEDNIDLIKEAADRFGTENMGSDFFCRADEASGGISSAGRW